MKFKKMRQVEIKPNMTVRELVNSMKDGGFTCRKLALASDIFNEMTNDVDVTKFLGLAGALIPGGMRNILRLMIENNLIDCIVTTGANISHDLIESSGGTHLHGSEALDDILLKNNELSRIYSTLIPYESFVKFEEMMQKVLERIPEERISTRTFLYELGGQIKDPKSILHVAHKKNIPIFSPSFADSILGVQTWLFSQHKHLFIDVLKDHSEFSEIVYDSTKMGALFLAGGVPKHFIMNGSQLHDGLSYAIQITMDRPEHGGVSGASVKEALSWGKVREGAKWVNVMADVTLVLPIIIASAITKI
ncbi:MAG: deoxyhypusine synthase [Candidatus Hodarchaeales archaeon]